MAAFEYRQAEEIQRVFAAHGVRYLFLGQSGALKRCVGQADEYYIDSVGSFFSVLEKLEPVSGAAKNITDIGGLRRCH